MHGQNQKLLNQDETVYMWADWLSRVVPLLGIETTTLVFYGDSLLPQDNIRRVKSPIYSLAQPLRCLEQLFSFLGILEIPQDLGRGLIHPPIRDERMINMRADRKECHWVQLIWPLNQNPRLAQPCKLGFWSYRFCTPLQDSAVNI